MDIILEDIARHAYSSKKTVDQSFFLAQKVVQLGIPGSLVETGVAAGAQIMAMAYGAKTIDGIGRPVVGFDSFEGIPLAGPKDTEQPGIGPITHDKFASPELLLKSSNITVHSLDSVIRNISTVFQSPTEVTHTGYGDNAIVDVKLIRTGQSFCFVKGWFEHTMPLKKMALKHQPIAVLRLDGDLYSSTKVVLDALFANVSDGGYIIVDDYALEGCKQAVHDFFDQIDWTPKKLFRIQGEFPVYFKKE